MTWTAPILPLAESAASCGGIGTYAWAFGQGVLVDLTPCVYPLIPVTVAIFGAKGVSKAKALFLATAYVLGMATLYTSLGLGVALLAGGAGFGTWLANPVVVVPLVLILLALAASMFGAFELQLPSSLETKLSSVGGAGPMGAFLMGLVSGLVSAPCTGPVLLNLLAFIAASADQPGGLFFGGSLLFTYALGMGTLFFAVALGASLFKPGPWMDHIKSVFGIALIVMAFYFMRPLSPALSGFVINPQWGLWLGVGIFVVGVAAGAVHRSFHGPMSEKLTKGAAVAVASFGAILALNNFMYVELTADWKQVETLDELEAAIARAEEAGKPILIDFGASWCNPCHELESQTFSNPEVEAELAKYELIKIDVSDPSEDQEAMQAALDAKELPSVVVYASDAKISEHVDTLRAGEPLPEPSVHVTTFVPPDEFLSRLAGSGVQANASICSRG
ncbi:thioredoxin family protein [Pseudenhygromyxa sp. WMMC2535]|uniref:protein-disulfide reductase DsbD family protein n=1 Tax=Pseudenhygromyxa sp. WMMC2535 TaxID=2712867 RepID=UPI001553057A|nr:cytochrome c biogenesis protein CcdA [Pseudenhygromyxa sp. WMMC2535]NVB41894.1 thioredoxin family protein [Pseudenhygromyxa sp. WMMC2535]